MNHTVCRPLLHGVAIGILLSSLACARREPLPGDSVALDGAVAIAPSRVETSAPTSAPLGAVESRLYPPELLMERQVELGLDELQRKRIITQVERAQAEMARLRWDLERQREALVKLLDADPVDENDVSASAKKMVDLESQIKTVHLAMLVRIKNELTPAQKSKLRAARGQ